MRSGFVSVVGRPNVGKSTLVNALVGSKVTITSSRPQTTRNTIRGVVTSGDVVPATPPGDVVPATPPGDGVEPAWQIVLVDTPGLHKPKTELGNRLNSLVYGSLAEADAVVFMLDARQPIGPGDRRIAERLSAARAPTIVVVNKVDVAAKGAVVVQLAEAAEWGFDSYVPLSALKRDNLEPLVDEIVSRLPEGPMYFEPGTRTDQPDHHLAAEVVREKFLGRLREELPHSLVVVIDDIEAREDGLQTMSGRVIVERDSQRGIVIGKGGSMLQTAGTEARLELEAIFGTKIHLELRVVVEPDWQRSPALLDRLGFEDRRQ